VVIDAGAQVSADMVGILIDGPGIDGAQEGSL
jgi:hypothetical protein